MNIITPDHIYTLSVIIFYATIAYCIYGVYKVFKKDNEHEQD